jgi:L-ribulose-5-phosphate 4-epimerase
MLEELKNKVCDANRLLEEHKLVIFSWGNVSGIDRESGIVAIKPSGVSYADLHPQDIILVDMDGKIVEGKLNPSSDTLTHLILYKAFTSIGGITHTHSRYATVFAQACRSIPPLGTTHADHFHGEVPITRPLRKQEVETDYEANTGVVIVDRFAKLNFEEVPGVLVANHGPFTWGQSASESVKHAVILEEVAHMAHATMSLNPQIIPMPPYILDKHFQRKHGPNAYYGQK